MPIKENGHECLWIHITIASIFPIEKCSTFASHKETGRAIWKALCAGLNECEMEIRQKELPISELKTAATNTIPFIHLGLAFH